MRTGGRLSAAVEILEEVIDRHRPAGKVLLDWGRSHRFAGSRDRSVIGTLVYDALRRRNSIASRMRDDVARALVLGAYCDAFEAGVEEVAQVTDGSDHCLSPLTSDERAGLERRLSDNAPLHIRGDFPQWLCEQFVGSFGSEERAIEAGASLAKRAPLDLRVNSLKSSRERVLKVLSKLDAVEAPLAPFGVRIPVAQAGGKMPNVEVEAGHGKGWFEIQDAGSQVAAALSGAGPREQVLDLCAGAGGKTLALAASMQNTGQVYSYDKNRFQLRPIFERLKRAGARNVQVMTAGDRDALQEMAGRFDLVFVDAPCSGSGTWRRRPDAKWRLKREHLIKREQEQRDVLDQAASMVRPGGRLCYVTCSIFAQENGDQVAAFLSRHQMFSWKPFAQVWGAHMSGEPPVSADGSANGLLLTPDVHGTDGFYIATIVKAA